MEEENHLPKWKDAMVLWCGQDKNRRKVMEAAVIK